jgi:hypothetical protein
VVEAIAAPAMWGEAEQAPAGRPSLNDRFVVPPFSVLDTRLGYWQARKQAWLALGIRSELGRGLQNAVARGRLRDVQYDPESASISAAEAYDETAIRAGKEPPKRAGRGANYGGKGSVMESMNRRLDSRFEADQRSNVTGAPSLPEYADFGVANVAPGTSIFDPVLCELAYRWFAPPGGSILDPFAGGSVRGIVAEYLGRRYTGIELRGEQVVANREQAAGLGVAPRWIEGDSREIDWLLGADEEFDLIFSCPPYYNLELYSDDPRDVSNAESYPQFLEWYSEIIALAAGRLRDDRFACYVVSDVRDTKSATGHYHGFVVDTIRAFEAAGLRLYNEGVLINPAATLPMRVPRQFAASRKLGRMHQNVLVFSKGKPDPHGWSIDLDDAPPDPQMGMF